MMTGVSVEPRGRTGCPENARNAGLLSHVQGRPVDRFLRYFASGDGDGSSGGKKRGLQLKFILTQNNYFNKILKFSSL
jgi:hypothetical protein